MAKIDLGNDDGFVEFTLDGKEYKLDLRQTANQIREFHIANKDRPDSEYGPLLVEFQNGIGVPVQTVTMAMAFNDMIRDEYAKKNGRGSTKPASPASTDSHPEA